MARSWMPSKVGRASVSLVPWLCSLGAVQFVDQGCVDLFVDAIEWGSVSEGLVPRRSALRAGLFVDRGCFDLFADAVKHRAMLVRVWCHDALGAVSVVDQGLFDLFAEAGKGCQRN